MTGKGQNQNQNPRLLTPDSGLSFYVRHPFCQLEDQLWLYLQALIKVLGMVEKAWTLELNLHLNSCLLLTSKSLTCRTAMSLLGLHPSVIYWNEVQHPCLVWELALVALGYANLTASPCVSPHLSLSGLTTPGCLRDRPSFHCGAPWCQGCSSTLLLGNPFGYHLQFCFLTDVSLDPQIESSPYVRCSQGTLTCLQQLINYL